MMSLLEIIVLNQSITFPACSFTSLHLWTRISFQGVNSDIRHSTRFFPAKRLPVIFFLRRRICRIQRYRFAGLACLQGRGSLHSHVALKQLYNDHITIIKTNNGEEFWLCASKYTVYICVQIYTVHNVALTHC